MSDVKTYYCAIEGEQVGPKTTPVVLATDYRALAAKLAAAEAKQEEKWFTCLSYKERAEAAEARVKRLEEALREIARRVPEARQMVEGGFHNTSFALVLAQEAEAALSSDAAQAEIARLKAGGCARDQRLTQYCAEAQAALARVAELERAIDGLLSDYDGDKGTLIDVRKRGGDVK